MPRLEPGMARIRVKDLRLRTYIGINEEEVLNKQDVLINLTVFYRSVDAVRDNDIDHALNYRTITKAVIAHVESNRFSLLERLTQDILDLVTVEYAEVEVDNPMRCVSQSLFRSPWLPGAKFLPISRRTVTCLPRAGAGLGADALYMVFGSCSRMP